MKRHCTVCGDGYAVEDFRLDEGRCERCLPLRSLPCETRSLWFALITFHLIVSAFCALLLDGGLISIPAGIYCCTVVGYFIVRIGIGERNRRRLPSLTRAERWLVSLLPAYGLPRFLSLFYLGQWIRHAN